MDQHVFYKNLELELQSHQVDVLRYLRRAMPRNLQRVFDPEDLLQDTYCEAAVSLHTYRPGIDTSPRRWIFGIARNRMRRALRHTSAQKRSAAVAGDSDLHFGQLKILLSELAIYSRTPSRSAISHEIVFALDHAVAQLSHDYRTAIQLRYIEGVPVDETAKRMSRTQRAVHMLCYRAMLELKDLLKGVEL